MGCADEIDLAENSILFKISNPHKIDEKPNIGWEIMNSLKVRVSDI